MDGETCGHAVDGDSVFLLDRNQMIGSVDDGVDDAYQLCPTWQVRIYLARHMYPLHIALL
jgi:hypothetical protein